MTTEELVAEIRRHVAAWGPRIGNEAPGTSLTFALLSAAATRLEEQHLAAAAKSRMHRRAQLAEREAARTRRRLNVIAKTAQHFAKLDAQ